MVDPHVGRTVVFNGCIYNHRELRAELEREGHRFFSTSDTEVIAKAHATVGRPLRRPLHGHVRLRARRARERPAAARPRPARHQAAVPRGRRRGAALRLHPARAARGRRHRHVDRPGRAAPLPLSWHGVVPPPRTILQGVRKLPPATLLVVEPDGRRTERALLVGAAQPAAGAGGLGRARLAGRAAGRAAHRGRPAHGGRRAGGRPALRGPGLEPHRRAARRGRPARAWRRSRSASSPAAAARATSSATPTSSRGSSGPSTTGSRSRRRAWSRRWTARSPR